MQLARGPSGGYTLGGLASPGPLPYDPGMLLRQRILPAGPIEPCLPTKADTLPSAPIKEIPYAGRPKIRNR